MADPVHSHHSGKLRIELVTYVNWFSEQALTNAFNLI